MKRMSIGFFHNLLTSLRNKDQETVSDSSAWSTSEYHYIYFTYGDAERMLKELENSGYISHTSFNSVVPLSEGTEGCLAVPVSYFNEEMEPHCIRWCDLTTAKLYMPIDLLDAYEMREKREQAEVENYEELETLKARLHSTERKLRPVSDKYHSLKKEIAAYQKAISRIYGGCPICQNCHWPHCED